MLASWMLALFGLSVDAHAASELHLRASNPVVLLVDGRPATVMSNLQMRASGLAPGAHEVRIVGMLGKTLYEGEVELQDETVLQAHWSDGELRFSEPTPRSETPVKAWPWDGEGRRPPGPLVADEVELAEAEPPVAEPPIPAPSDEGALLASGEAAIEAAIAEAEPDAGSPPRAAAEPSAEAPVVEEAALADGALDDGAASAPDAPLAIPFEAVAATTPEVLTVELPVPEPSADPLAAVQDVVGRRLVLEEGARLEVLHGDARLVLEVRDGALRLDDGEGLVLTVR